VASAFSPGRDGLEARVENPDGWERACIGRVLAGDRAAFARIYEAFAGAIFSRVLLPRLGDRRAAEDALSETFRSALEHLGGFDDRGAGLWPWLCRIAVNKANDMHRVRARTGRALASFESLLAPLAAPPDPRAEVERKGEIGRLRDAIARVLVNLSPRYRRAIELRFLEEKPREACADALGVAIGNFDVILLRALRAFRAEWTAAGETP